jgi:hypothetical protein
MWRGAASALVAVACLLVAAGARAEHPRVVEGQRLYGQADFAGALRAFAAAESSEDLSRGDLIALLEGRALVHFALDAREEATADLTALASVDPAHEFSGETPPEVRNEFASARRRTGGERVRVRIETEQSAGGVSLRAAVAGDVARLVREVVITARAGSGEWESGAGGILRVDAPRGTRVEYYAVAEGPGGAPVATLGTQSAPQAMVMGGTAPLGVGRDGDLDDRDGGGAAWLWIGVAAGVVVVAAVVTALLITSSAESDQTRVSCCFEE